MIEIDQFSGQFDKICAAFGLTKPDKTKTAWFNEFEECDYFTFCRAIKILQRGDRFPNWGMIWDTYTPILPKNLRVTGRKGCADCERGLVFYVDYIRSKIDDPKSLTMVYGLAANCKSCSRNAIGPLANVFRKDMVQQDCGEYWTEKAIMAFPEEQEKVENDRLKRKKEWKKDGWRARRFQHES